MLGMQRRESKTTGDSKKTGKSTQKSGKSILKSLRSRAPSKDALKPWFLLAITVAAIISSVLTIYSCKFFSYKEVDVFNDGYSSDAEISYEPFEYLPRAGVGLFSYFMGDPTGKGVMMNDQMCFYYCDEYTDYQWLSSNNKDTGMVDKWVLARYCSIFAPIFGLLAFLQMLVETIVGYKIPFCGHGMLLKTQIFLIAAFFQIGTFMVVLAPPIMYSSEAEDQKQQFCFSESSNVRCRMDTGSMFSLASTVMYLILAHTAFYTRRSTTEKAGTATKDDAERDTDESSISDISDSNSESQHSKSHPEGNAEDSDSDASVFSTLINYFGRNQDYDETDIDSDSMSNSNSRDGKRIKENARDIESDPNSHSSHTTLTDDNRRHNQRQNREEPNSGGDEHATEDAPGLLKSIHLSLTSARSVSNKTGKRGKNTTTTTHATPTSSAQKRRTSRVDSTVNNTSKENTRGNVSLSSNTQRELGIKLNPMIPYSGFNDKLGSVGSF